MILGGLVLLKYSLPYNKLIDLVQYVMKIRTSEKYNYFFSSLIYLNTVDLTCTVYHNLSYIPSLFSTCHCLLISLFITALFVFNSISGGYTNNLSCCSLSRLCTITAFHYLLSVEGNNRLFI